MLFLFFRAQQKHRQSHPANMGHPFLGTQLPKHPGHFIPKETPKRHLHPRGVLQRDPQVARLLSLVSLLGAVLSDHQPEELLL